MQINFDIPLIRDGKSKDLVSYLNELRQNHSDVAICQSLFEAVDQEYIPPDIFSIFIPWSKSSDIIALCVHNQQSRFVRNQGIKFFGKVLADPERWEAAWLALGGSEGLVSLFAELSVIDVRALSTAIGCCKRAQHEDGVREETIEELLRALLPTHYPGSKYESHDKRPIQHHYAQMAPACSDEFIAELLDAEDESNPLYRRLPVTRLIRTHGELLRRRVIEGIFGDGNEDKQLPQFLAAFVYSQPPRPGPDQKVSASMAFAMSVLQSRLKDIDNDKYWPATVSEADIFFSLFRRSLKKRLPEARVYDVIKLGLQMVEAQPKLKSNFKSKDIWSKLIARWKRTPKLYGDLISLALRLGLGAKSEKTISRDFLQTLQAASLRPELRWPLLRLYCLHVPRKGIDIDSADDYTTLGDQQWSSDLFYQLNTSQALRLLKGLQDANPEYPFLVGSGVLADQKISTYHNFNAELLEVILRRGSEETQRKAEAAVDDLRKKSATAREQLDRARLAKGASSYAIASGSLDLYAETITWQQRYVRDPLTVKTIFARDAVTTTEGIELLSGIPKPFSSLAEVASRVEKANKILLTLEETMRMAKREPSFHQPDWQFISQLFGDVISQRVARATDLQKHLKGSDADVYTAIWGGTLAMVEKVGVDFLNAARGPIRDLFETLPPKALAATTKSMLEAGKERRKKQDREPGDDILEHLSYDVLLRLGKSDKPELGQQLVLQTILDRPDASSWHRQMLSVAFMKRLSAKDAQELLLAFAVGISEKLGEQSFVRVGEAEPAKSAPPQSLVKVTTVKYLAQLLDNAEFISADNAVEVLVELFKAGTHRDIRLATLDSLLSLLNSICSRGDEGWRSNPLVEKIMGALETVIPVLVFRERQPMRPQDWEEAKETGTVPAIPDVSLDLPPLLNAMLTAADGRQYPGLKNLQAEFVARFFLPILELSQAEHMRWVALFLTKYNYKARFTVKDLPRTPVRVRVWETLVRSYPDFVPQTVFEDYNEHIVMTIAPPAALTDFNKSLRADPNLRNTAEVRHWLLIFGRSMNQYSSSGTQTFVSMVHHGWPTPSIQNGISAEWLMSAINSHASLFLNDYERYTGVWKLFTRDLRMPSESPGSIPSMVSAWQKSGRLLLEQITSLVVRTRIRHAAENKRTLLPSVTKLRLWLLPYPCFPDITEADFVKALEELLDTLLKGEANVLRWPNLAEDAFTISELLNTDEERLRVASYIGGLEEPSDKSISESSAQKPSSGGSTSDPESRTTSDQRESALNLIRVALALRLIEEGQNGLKKDAKGELVAESKDLVQRLQKRIVHWQNDDDESIRERIAEWRKQENGLWKTLMGK
ncbi:hypothetical protein NA57DRAFT_70363 [Rhizodiscina lignyota]|uniref:Uncharacterized protein n=1 Tax=Rhizodiscina lignyota TaxID=1504668 RepID=A0A9P4IMA5_9PEZI|nr:hypothetical protein NA57DRAFT_70363 [Rhizodiscina lignyota]